MSDIPRIPPAILKLKLPDEIRDALVKEVRALGLDTERFVDALPRFYALGFYDGALAMLRSYSASDVGGVDDDVI